MSELRDNFVEYIKLTEVDISNMTLQELFDHKFEIQRLSKIRLKKLDEMEKKNPTKIN